MSYTVVDVLRIDTGRTYRYFQLGVFVKVCRRVTGKLHMQPHGVGVSIKTLTAPKGTSSEPTIDFPLAVGFRGRVHTQTQKLLLRIVQSIDY